MYTFHRITHSKTSGGKQNWEKKENPIKTRGELLEKFNLSEEDLEEIENYLNNKKS